MKAKDIDDFLNHGQKLICREYPFGTRFFISTADCENAINKAQFEKFKLTCNKSHDTGQVWLRGQTRTYKFWRE